MCLKEDCVMCACWRRRWTSATSTVAVVPFAGGACPSGHLPQVGMMVFTGASRSSAQTECSIVTIVEIGGDDPVMTAGGSRSLRDVASIV